MGDEHFTMDDYSPPIRRDREGRTGGGVAAWVYNGLQYKVWSELKHNILETLWLTVWSKHMPREYARIIIGVIYHPGTLAADHKMMSDHIIHCVDQIRRKHPYSGVMITGDFNRMPDHRIKSMLQVKQTVSSPTRENATLDKLFTDMVCFYPVTVVGAAIGSSDHNSIISYPASSRPVRDNTAKTTTTRVMGHNEKVMFAHELQQQRWEPLYRLPTCTEQLTYFLTTITELMEKHFPVKYITKREKDKPWITDEYKSLIQKRHQARCRGDLVTYRETRNKVNRLSSQLEKSFYDSKIKNLQKSDCKNWWKNMKALLGIGKGDLSPFYQLADELHDGDITSLAGEINNFFQSVTSHLEPLSTDAYPLNNNFDVPDEALVSTMSMERHLSHTKVNKSCGPDLIPAWVYKDFCHILAGPMTAIVNSSLREGMVPTAWKSANVTPLPKVLPLGDIRSDLRPISLTPIGSKILEYFPCQDIYSAVTDKVDPLQFGGLKGSSTTMALLYMLHYAYKETDKAGTYLRILLADYSKAFDLVDHQKLTSKLQRLEVPDNLVKWSASFLTNRG
jgi:hypothetical protein